jgi:hypothetical protein
MMCRRHHDALDQRLFPFAEMSDAEIEAFKEQEIFLAREFVAGRRTVSA